MRTDAASRTAGYMALFRAIESARPVDRRLFNDPFAPRFLEGRLQLAASVARLPRAAEGLAWIIDRRWPGARSSGVARTRLIDDALAEALRDGVAQVVLLGAGFDARAYRLPALATVRVIEVDHPNTLAAKRRRLAHANVDVSHVRFAAIDFDRQRLDEVLTPLADASARTFFIWEGVTNYLSADAVDTTLRFIARAAAGSKLLFTYVDRGVLEAPGRYVGTSTLRHVLVGAGEPWTFGLDPPEVPRYLRDRGLELEWDLGATEYRARYYGPAATRLRGYEFYHAALARVPSRP